MTTFPLHAMHGATGEISMQESVVGPDDEDEDEREVVLPAAPEER